MPLSFIFITKHFQTGKRAHKHRDLEARSMCLCVLGQTAHELFCGAVEYLWVQSHVAPTLCDVRTSASYSFLKEDWKTQIIKKALNHNHCNSVSVFECELLLDLTIHESGKNSHKWQIVTQNHTHSSTHRLPKGQWVNLLQLTSQTK